MKMRKRFIVLSLAAVMLISVPLTTFAAAADTAASSGDADTTDVEQTLDVVDSVSVTAYASSGTCGSNLTWKLTNSGVLTIRGTGDMTDYSSSGAPWLDDCDEITSVVIKNGVTSISAYAFYGCTNMESISIADTVTSIGE